MVYKALLARARLIYLGVRVQNLMLNESSVSRELRHYQTL